MELTILAESVSRTVRNWLTGRSVPARREDVFRIAFALGLSEAQADRLLGCCSGYGIHYREGRDAVYAWFLRNGARFLRVAAAAAPAGGGDGEPRREPHAGDAERLPARTLGR